MQAEPSSAPVRSQVPICLSPIPEMYRLHVPRAEEIVNRCLTVWLETVEKTLGDLLPMAAVGGTWVDPDEGSEGSQTYVGSYL